MFPWEKKHLFFFHTLVSLEWLIIIRQYIMQMSMYFCICANQTLLQITQPAQQNNNQDLFLCQFAWMCTFQTITDNLSVDSLIKNNNVCSDVSSSLQYSSSICPFISFIYTLDFHFFSRGESRDPNMPFLLWLWKTANVGPQGHFHWHVSQHKDASHRFLNAALE